MLVTQLRRWLDQSWQGKAQRDDMLSRLGKVVALRSHDGNNNGIGHRPRPHLGRGRGICGEARRIRHMLAN
jgi:hypothetical protein